MSMKVPKDKNTVEKCKIVQKIKATTFLYNNFVHGSIEEYPKAT